MPQNQRSVTWEGFCYPLKYRFLHFSDRLLGTSLIAMQGYTAPEVEQTYSHARHLCAHLNDPLQLFAVLLGLWQYYVVRDEHQTAHELAEQLLTLAQQVQDATMLLAAHQILGTTLFFMGAVAAAHTHI